MTPAPRTTLPRDGETLLQTLAMPDPAICGEADLFVHRNPRVTLDLEAGALDFLPGGTVWFDTYMNLFNLGVWTRACRLGGLTLRLVGSGEVALQVIRARVPGETDILAEHLLTLSEDGIDIDAGALLGGGDEIAAQVGVLTLRLVAQGAARLTAGGWLTRTADPKPVRLAISVTTFRREAEVAATAARVAAFLDAGGLAGTEAHLFVVDNGGSAAPAPHPAVTLVTNPNLGGAGGFARGLACATDGGFSHCLFMDDDATFAMESLIRAVAVLRLARSPKAAVSGAMISEARKWVMWENGAVFNKMCAPQFVGTDLRDAYQVTRMELQAARPKPDGFYGGWWFFAFPVAEVSRWPFPFFVRGDDISFSLANKFDTVTLNGVVSFQEDFSSKESPLTLYLDLRNHLHQHLVHERLEIGAWGTTKIALHFIARSIIRMHYDSAEAQLQAWDDVMKGPEFFAENADMAKRRPEIAALARTEKWRDASQTGEVKEPKEPSRAWGQALKLTLNGHLIPFWKLIARSTAIPASHRGLIWPVWGKSRARFFSVDGLKSYEVTHSKTRFLKLTAGVVQRAIRWRAAYPALRAAHRKGYAEMAARPFWEVKFAPSGSASAPAATPAAVPSPAPEAAPEAARAAAE